MQQNRHQLPLNLQPPSQEALILALQTQNYKGISRYLHYALRYHHNQARFPRISRNKADTSQLHALEINLITIMPNEDTTIITLATTQPMDTHPCTLRSLGLLRIIMGMARMAETGLPGA